MSREMFSDFLYLRLYSFYREDLDINEVKDYNNDIIKPATSTVDRQIQGYAQFCVTFNIFVSIRVIETISVYISPLLIIMNFYSPVSNTRCHSIGHKMRIARIKIRVDSPGRWERA